MASYNYNNMNCRRNCSFTEPSIPISHKEHFCMPQHEKPLAMAYVKIQQYDTTFPAAKALQMGTIFPDLCKPFCGKRGNCR